MILKNKKNDFKNELNPTTLLPLIRNKKWPIKIIGDQKTKITQAYKVKVHKISQGAKKAIEAAGGSIELIKQEIKNKVKDKQTKKIQKVKK
jgi:ribosomal protein L15